MAQTRIRHDEQIFTGFQGDILYRDAGGELINLGIGASLEVLTVVGGIPSWEPNTLPVGVADGDTLYWDDTAGEWVILPAGSAGEILTIVGGIPSWEAPFSLTGVQYQIGYFDPANTLITEAGSAENALTWRGDTNRLGIRQATPQSVLHLGNQTSAGTVHDEAIILTRWIHTTNAIGANSIIGGGATGERNSVVGARSFVINGRSNGVAGNDSAAIGVENSIVAGANINIVAGYQNTVTAGTLNVLIGSGNHVDVASNGNHLIGTTNQVDGGTGIKVFGSLNNIVDSNGGIVIGRNNTLNAPAQEDIVLLGANNSAIATGAKVIAQNGVGNGNHQTVLGFLNVGQGSQASATFEAGGNSGDDAFILGNGITGTPSNAYAITWNGIHRFAAGGARALTTDPTAVAGAYFYLANRGTARDSDGGNWFSIPGVLFTQTQTITVTNTITETSLLGTGVGSKTIAANTLVAGKTYRVKAKGIMDIGVGQDIRIRFDFGGVTINSVDYTGPADITSGNLDLEWEFTVRTTGATGSLIAQALGIFGTGIGTGGANATTNTINTTIANALDITAQWSVAETYNTVVITNVTIEKLN